MAMVCVFRPRLFLSGPLQGQGCWSLGSCGFKPVGCVSGCQWRFDLLGAFGIDQGL